MTCEQKLQAALLREVELRVAASRCASAYNLGVDKKGAIDDVIETLNRHARERKEENDREQ